MSSWDTNPWNDFSNSHWELICCNKWQKTGLLSTQNQTWQSSINCVSKQWTWTVLFSTCWFKTVRMLKNILITRSKCWNGVFEKITQMLSYTHTMAEMLSYSTVLSYIEMFSCSNMADCCVNKQLKVTPKVSCCLSLCKTSIINFFRPNAH